MVDYYYNVNGLLIYEERIYETNGIEVRSV